VSPDIVAKHIKVATNPNFEMVPMFLKNFFLLMLNPDGNTISGKIKLKKKTGLNSRACLSSSPT